MLETNVAKQYIEENNEKRELLKEENLKIYEDFLVYFRSDLRIAEREAEELLLELLDHLLIAQQEGRPASALLGEDPRAYADELISGLPREKKKNVLTFVGSQIVASLGWFSLVIGLVHLILPRFTDVREVMTLGNMLLLALAVMFLSGLGVNIMFKLIRSTLFKEKKQQRSAYWKAGVFGGGSFALIMLVAWLTPEFGPTLNLDWWIYLGTGGVLVLGSKVHGSISN
jgi:uncharacterized membrane-anchored protein